MSVLSSQLVNAALACFWSSAFTTDPDYWLTWRPLPAAEEKISSKSHMNASVKVCLFLPYQATRLKAIL